MKEEQEKEEEQNYIFFLIYGTKYKKGITSGKEETLLVLVHKLLLSEGANSRFLLLITLLRYS